MATNRRELGGNRTIQLQIDYPDFDRHLAFLSPGETFAARTVAFCSTLLGGLKPLSASVCVHLRLDRLNGLFASIRGLNPRAICWVGRRVQDYRPVVVLALMAG
jgi:hypothetical protein